MTEEYKNPERLSECCAAEMYSDYDVCPQCGEHATSMETDEQ
jgi:predicted amidophosphoribosyltransferase